MECSLKHSKELNAQRTVLWIPNLRGNARFLVYTMQICSKFMKRKNYIVKLFCVNNELQDQIIIALALYRGCAYTWEIKYNCMKHQYINILKYWFAM